MAGYQHKFSQKINVYRKNGGEKENSTFLFSNLTLSNLSQHIGMDAYSISNFLELEAILPISNLNLFFTWTSTYL